MCSHSLLMFKANKKPNLAQGFGLVEMLVSIGILILVMSVVVTNQGAFNSAVLLRGQAYELAFQAREIQLFAVSIVGDSTSVYRNAYGLHFSTATADAKTKYQVFRNNNSVNFTFESGEEFGPQGILDQRFEIDTIRVIGTGATPSEVSIIFERPNFDAKFYDAGGSLISTASAIEIDVRLKGTTGTGAGKVRTVEITKTGQIAVKPAS